MAADPKFKNGPLSDLRVIEMGTLLAGPFCGQLLGDMGAEVIKIEPPGGDPLAVRDEHLFETIDALRPAVPTIRMGISYPNRRGSRKGSKRIRTLRRCSRS